MLTYIITYVIITIENERGKGHAMGEPPWIKKSKRQTEGKIMETENTKTYTVYLETSDYCTEIDNIEAPEGYTAKQYIDDCSDNGIDWTPEGNYKWYTIYIGDDDDEGYTVNL